MDFHLIILINFNLLQLPKILEPFSIKILTILLIFGIAQVMPNGTIMQLLIKRLGDSTSLLFSYANLYGTLVKKKNAI